MYYGCKLQIWKYNLHERGYILKKLGFTWHTLMLSAEQRRHDQQLCVHYITLHYITLHYIILYCIILYLYLYLYYTILYYIILYYIILYIIILYYITLWIACMPPIFNVEPGTLHLKKHDCRSTGVHSGLFGSALLTTLHHNGLIFSERPADREVVVVLRLPDCEISIMFKNPGENRW